VCVSTFLSDCLAGRLSAAWCVNTCWSVGWGGTVRLWVHLVQLSTLTVVPTRSTGEALNGVGVKGGMRGGEAPFWLVNQNYGTL